MSQNFSPRIPRSSFIYTIILVFIFIATNPVITIAQDARNSLYLEWFSLVQMTQAFVCNNNDSRDQSVLSDVELKMVAMVNQERMEAGLAKLAVDLTLVKLAEEKGRDMVRFDYFGHHSERLGTIYDQLDQARISYQLAAENLIGAPNYRRAETVVFASSAQRSNILNPHFQKIGIGIIKGGPYGEMIVQILVD